MRILRLLLVLFSLAWVVPAQANDELAEKLGMTSADIYILAAKSFYPGAGVLVSDVGGGLRLAWGGVFAALEARAGYQWQAAMMELWVYKMVGASVTPNLDLYLIAGLGSIGGSGVWGAGGGAQFNTDFGARLFVELYSRALIGAALTEHGLRAGLRWSLGSPSSQ